MSTILITGGCGFIGSNFARYILEETKYNVVVLDLLTYCGNLYNVLDLRENYSDRFKFIAGDICNDSLQMERLFSKVEFVVNFAAESHVDNSIRNPNIFYKTNVMGTLNLLNICRKTGVVTYLQVSTDEVYGSLQKDEDPFTELSIIKPNSPYSASKAAADMLVMAYYKTYGMPVVITRCSNNYGPYQYPEKLIPLCIERLQKGESVPVYGTGENVRDWIHVYDHCRAILTVLEKGTFGEVYNIGSNNEKTNLQIIEQIVRALNKDDYYLKYVQFVKDRAGHDLRYAIDSSKIQSLGWKPVKRFEESLRETVYWYQENKDWLKHIEERRKLWQ